MLQHKRIKNLLTDSKLYQMIHHEKSFPDLISMSQGSIKPLIFRGCHPHFLTSNFCYNWKTKLPIKTQVKSCWISVFKMQLFHSNAAMTYSISQKNPLICIQFYPSKNMLQCQFLEIKVELKVDTLSFLSALILIQYKSKDLMQFYHVIRWCKIKCLLLHC